MTADRIVEYQRVAMVCQQRHLEDALRRLRSETQRAEMLASELEVQAEHNATLFALLLHRDRQIASVRAELLQVRGILGEELR